MSLYYHSETVHNLLAPREVVPLICKLTSPTSVLDVGCGLGTWLKAFSESGVEDYLGLDGNHVDLSRLKVDVSHFKVQDLTQRWDLGRKFDLVVSLEVAEHLPEAASETFVEMLVNHGKSIVFSAAIPGQGGQNHLNEQWTDYWRSKFKEHGYYFHDVIRPAIWNNTNVEWWYKQNMFLVTQQMSNEVILDIIHPDVFLERSRQLEDIHAGKAGIKTAIDLLGKSLMRRATKNRKT